jgi:hypothetical protein
LFIHFVYRKIGPGGRWLPASFYNIGVPMTDNSRRHFLTTAAAALACGLVLTALLAIAGHDPIFAVIDANLAATRAVDEALMAGAFHSELQVAAEHATAEAVVNTAPSTWAALRALKRHLSDDRNSLCWWHIRDKLLAEGQTFEP